MPPSPTHKTDYAAEALSLLTSRYQKARPGGLVTGAAAVAMAPWSLAATGSIFTPASVSGVLAWYRADLGVTTSTGVSGWSDQSGSGDAGRNLTQATGTKQPSVNASDASYKNKPTLSFASGSGQYLTSGAWSTGSMSEPYTIFIVGNDDGTSTNQVFVDNQIGASGESLLWNLGGVYAVGAVSSGIAASATPKVIIAQHNGASSSINVSASTATPISAPSETMTGITAGASIAPGTYLNGKIAEMAFWARALTPTEVAALNTYAHNRYGILIS